ncbi:hypothetical protein LZG00_13855 [Rhodobacteraceae bacterium LMO-12]|nr:hypothetical protein [Rhodobacteraceae bacterium LMO-JJ12]
MSDKLNTRGQFDQIRSEHRALALLRLLDIVHEYRINSQIAVEWLRKIALAGTTEEVVETISALERLDLIRTDQAENLTIIELTEMGQDVALGRNVVDGVLRPVPDCPY